MNRATSAAVIVTDGPASSSPSGIASSTVIAVISFVMLAIGSAWSEPLTAKQLVELARINDKRAPGDKIAGAPGGLLATEPKPGERDLSQPQVVLPEGIRGLLGGNAAPQAPADPRLPTLPGSAQSAPDPVIDFLLAP